MLRHVVLFRLHPEVGDEAAYRVYAKHPRHRRVIRERIAPLEAERTAVQYDPDREGA